MTLRNREPMAPPSPLSLGIRLVVTIGSAVLAYGSWAVWEQAKRNSASPGAVVILIAFAVFALVAVASAFAFVRGLRERRKAAAAKPRE